MTYAFVALKGDTLIPKSSKKFREWVPREGAAVFTWMLLFCERESFYSSVHFRLLPLLTVADRLVTVNASRQMYGNLRCMSHVKSIGMHASLLSVSVTARLTVALSLLRRVFAISGTHIASSNTAMTRIRKRTRTSPLSQHLRQQQTTRLRHKHSSGSHCHSDGTWACYAGPVYTPDIGTNKGMNGIWTGAGTERKILIPALDFPDVKQEVSIVGSRWRMW